jgi:purine-binding chemotaxis protein CheW
MVVSETGERNIMPNATLEIAGAGTPSADRNSARAKNGGNLPPSAAHVREQIDSLAATSDHRVGKYLTFLLGREEFAIQVLKVREIIGMQDITSVPQMPAHIKGVINLRGKVIPVVDLRLKFCLPEMEYTQRTCIIVVQVLSAGVALQTGIIVDEVSEVLNLAAADIEDTPEFGESSGPAGTYLLGMAKVKGKVKILLDIDRVLSAQEVHGLDALSLN